jgi:hypothetical protein
MPALYRRKSAAFGGMAIFGGGFETMPIAPHLRKTGRDNRPAFGAID